MPTQQAQRAWATWVGRGGRSKEVAREGAVGLLQQIAHPLASPTARARFVRIVAELGSGTALTLRGRAELLDAVRDVMEPHSVFAASGLVPALGPAQAPMTVETVAGCTEAISVALRHTLAGKVTGPQLEMVRAMHRASMADNLRQHRELATSAGELTELFREPTVQEPFDEVGRQLLLTLGFELTRHRTDRRPKDPGPRWQGTGR